MVTKRKKFYAVKRVNGRLIDVAIMYSDKMTKEGFRIWLKAGGVDFDGIQTVNCY